jgi:hypothetical protein
MVAERLFTARFRALAIAHDDDLRPFSDFERGVSNAANS